MKFTSNRFCNRHRGLSRRCGGFRTSFHVNWDAPWRSSCSLLAHHSSRHRSVFCTDSFPSTTYLPGSTFLPARKTPTNSKMSPKSEAPSIQAQEQQHLSVDGHAREVRPSKLPRNLSASTLKKLSKFSVAAATATSSVKFVPAQVPRKRRLQTLAVATWSVMIVITSCTWIFLW